MGTTTQRHLLLHLFILRHSTISHSLRFTWYMYEIAVSTFDPIVDFFVAYGEQVAAVALAHTARIRPIPRTENEPLLDQPITNQQQSWDKSVEIGMLHCTSYH